MNRLLRLWRRLRRPRFVTGGVISGPRDPSDDSVPVLLSRGCVPPHLVEYYGEDMLRQLNERRLGVLIDNLPDESDGGGP